MYIVTDQPHDTPNTFSGCLVKLALFLVLFLILAIFLFGIFVGIALAGSLV